MKTNQKRAILIAGPTASGKSEVALELATALDGVIINADSMQVYKELSLITARPTAKTLAAVPHTLFGNVNANAPFSVADWLDLAKKETETAWRGRKIPIFTGGTGLYFKALLQGLTDVPDIPDNIRDGLRTRLETQGIDTLYDELQVKDPKMAVQLKPKDKQRIVRALEVLMTTGKSLSAWHGQHQKGALEGAMAVKISLESNREHLEQKIRKRFEEMVTQGALEEAKVFHAKNIDPAQPATKALGLRPLIRHIQGEITLEEAIELTVIETRQYAKRQRTWFRGQFPDWKKVEAGKNAALSILTLAKKAFAG